MWLTITNLAVLNNGNNPDIVTNTIGQTFVPKTAENFSYDFDGNLTNDGRWTYTWDAENRLVRMVANTTTGPQQRMDFEFDAKGRRIGKKVWNNTAGSGSPAVEQKFVYDGWNLLAVLNSAFSPQTAYTWGLDLSGSLQGAGGVGGLLALNDVANGVQYCSYDGNGNLAALVKATDGAVTANYEYGPFGEALRLTGAMAKVNPFRFSTKYQDEETDLLYYGYRSYNPSVGRWLSRDPIEEGDSANNYCFLKQNAINEIDLLGLATLEFGGVKGTFNASPLGGAPSGEWSQPPGVGSGYFTPSDLSTAKDRASSFVDLDNSRGPWGSLWWGNFCTTVYWPEGRTIYGVDDAGDAGSLFVLLTDPNGGDFRVTGKYYVNEHGKGTWPIKSFRGCNLLNHNLERRLEGRQTPTRFAGYGYKS